MKAWFTRAGVAVLLLALVAACGHSRVVKREGARPAPRPASVEVPRDGSYVVRRGDTLYGIAFRHGLDYREVAGWNGIRAPYTIYPGQRLKLRGGQRVAATSGGSVTGMPPARPAPTPSGTPATTPPARPAATTPATTPGRATTPPPPTPPATSGIAGAWRWPANGQIIGRFVAGDPKRQGLDIAGSAGDPVLAAADGVVVYSGAGLVGYGELIIVKHSDEWLSAYAHNRRRLVGEGASVKGGQQIAELGRTGTSRDMLHFEVRRNGKPVDPLQVLPAR
ncbi:peptidoglycan DD-metalloendopeptidase family protein [Arenimonas caeni]|uniref:LysM domain-containing protein n=1 Tax=Arenimonas caeni TaxID=2058085 RepID=A0A2P6MCJ1_9GAMM|nr:peptidoglycan DD-metalloendopeptidase family protein [Arenimonas caeni]PRH83686.1 hypothetical protein C6N40_00650 [Arenimonas caeni]